MEQYNSCEEYGHDYVADEDDPMRVYCRDCHDSYLIPSGVGTDANKE
jgi:hypothetical protein